MGVSKETEVRIIWFSLEATLATCVIDPGIRIRKGRQAKFPFF